MHAQDDPASVETPERFADFEFLIGEWRSEVDGQVGGEGEFAWGPYKAYIRWTFDRILPDGRRGRALDGILVHNGVDNRVEYVLALGPGRVMEKGDFEVFEDGRLRRNIEVFYPEGTPLPPAGEDVAPEGGYVRTYEQMFIPVDENTIRSSVAYMSEEGKWTPAFPGSDDFIMQRVVDE